MFKQLYFVGRERQLVMYLLDVRELLESIMAPDGP